MKASEAGLLKFLRRSPQFIIPIYQRTYAWTTAQCQQLWDDVIRTGTNDQLVSHFIGSIVYIEDGLSQVTDHSPLLVIDGQQRLTTVILILEALSRVIPPESEPVDGFTPTKLRNRYLKDGEEDGERAYKLLLTQTDKDSLTALLDQKDLPAKPSVRVMENFDFFAARVEALGDDLAPLCRGLSKLMVVDIALNRDHDNPQLIFESMNSTGKELSQADLIRNSILMGLQPKPQTALYNDHWRPMEVAFGQEGYQKYFDAFMRHYLTARTGEIPRIREVYEAFKAYARRPEVDKAGIEALVSDVHRSARYYCCFAIGGEANKRLAEAFADLRELKVDVAHPLLLILYEDYESGLLSIDNFHTTLRWIESYVFRRAVVGIPPNSLNKTFLAFIRELDRSRYLESFQAYLLLQPSYRRFPPDEEFRSELVGRNLYNFPRRSYWLRRMENHSRKERVAIEEYTIEHILPQNENLSIEWQNALGPDWENVRNDWLHTLGNLTLTRYNSEMSDRSFAEKRTMEGGFADSPLRLNQGLGQVEVWNEAAIRERAERLSHKAVEIWGTPSLSNDILRAYRDERMASRQAYSLDVHKYLVREGHSRDLYLVLRKEFLAFDPCVNEEILRHYIAYKAETNFVDVAPLATSLCLFVNMDPSELVDPQGLGEDLTGVGRPGNGRIRVRLEQTEQIPYVVGLARQAFEKQMSAGVGAE